MLLQFFKGGFFEQAFYISLCLRYVKIIFYDLAEQHSPFLEKHGSHHDAVKNTNASFGWGTKSGKEYLELEPRLKYVFEKSYNDEMKKYSIRGKLFAIVGRNINNRLAVFKW